MSTTRSQLYCFARDLGNIEAVEHGYKRPGSPVPPVVPWNAWCDGPSIGRGTARSTSSFEPSVSGPGGRSNSDPSPRRGSLVSAPPLRMLRR